MIDVRARDNSGARNGLRFVLRGLSALLAVLFITSCGNDIFVVGTPIITLTVQRGNFTNYFVVIDEIEMTRKDGTVIELPTVSEQVDLANLGKFFQLLEAPAVGVGTYVSATFFLDYTSASVAVDIDGQSGPTTLIDDSTGTVPTVDTITVNFDPDNPLVITSQNSSVVNFNIDLEASNTVDYSGGLPATVHVHPMITLSAVPTYEKPVFARGLFVFVDTTNADFVMNTRPLHDVLNNPFGAMTVIPNDQTYWNINGNIYVGSAGLTILAGMSSQTYSLPIGVVGTPGNPFGDFTTIQPSMTAAQIYVGTSLESTIQDHITGIIASHTSNSINILGASLVDRLGEYGFTNLVAVTIAPSTIVRVDGVASPSPVPTVDTLSVGQYIDVAGQVNPNDPNFVNPDGTLNPDGLDATNGQVRIQPTTVWGTLVSGTTSSATVSLAPVGWIEHTEPTLLNFAGTGTSSSADATPANYVIATPTDQSATAAGTLLKFVGVTTPFSSGPPYFTASTVTPASSLPQQLIIEWTGNGSPNPFTDLAATGIFINLNDPTFTGTGARHVIRSGPQETDVLNLPNPNPSLLVVVPASPTPNPAYQYSVGNVLQNISVFSDPATFAQSIQYYTGAVNAVTKLVATGQYDGAGHFVATNIEISIY